MLNIFRSVLTGVLAAALTLSAADVISGTWKMNPGKSKYSPGPGPKSSTMTISMDGDWILAQTDSVDAEGKGVKSTNRYKFDGKEYPYTTAVVTGTIVAKKVDDHHFGAMIKGGQANFTSKVVYSKDGKTRTLTTTGTNAQGKATHNVVVYEKQ